jgi:hypothetical protein
MHVLISVPWILISSPSSGESYLRCQYRKNYRQIPTQARYLEIDMIVGTILKYCNKEITVLSYAPPHKAYQEE